MRRLSLVLPLLLGMLALSLTTGSAQTPGPGITHIVEVRGVFGDFVPDGTLVRVRAVATGVVCAEATVQGGIVEITPFIQPACEDNLRVLLTISEADTNREIPAVVEPAFEWRKPVDSNEAPRHVVARAISPNTGKPAPTPTPTSTPTPLPATPTSTPNPAAASQPEPAAAVTGDVGPIRPPNTGDAGLARWIQR